TNQTLVWFLTRNSNLSNLS
ncbi:unnamed protein product, partial [Allacma fusca]